MAARGVHRHRADGMAGRHPAAGMADPVAQPAGMAAPPAAPLVVLVVPVAARTAAHPEDHPRVGHRRAAAGTADQATLNASPAQAA